MLRTILASLAITTLAFGQATLLVPQQFPTISAAINAAVHGDTVLVSPGTYNENLLFGGREIEVRSTSGPELTIVQGTGTTSVLRVMQGEGDAALFEGFTLTQGVADYGGGIHIANASPRIRNCIVRQNLAYTVGGGIYIDGSPLIENCTVHHNDWATDGGGIYVLDGSPVIRNCIVRDNNAGCYGPGIYATGSGVVEILNCTVYRNRSLDYFPQAAGISGFGAMIKVVNTISRENTKWLGNPRDIYLDPPSFAAHSNFFGATPANGNSSANPRLVDPANNDFRLQHDSPCRDTGSAAILSLSEFDFVGNPRVVGAGPDMGAYEFQQGTLYCFGDGGGTPCPCANAGGVNQGCAHGGGTGATLTSAGQLDVGIDDLVLHGSGLLPGNAALFLQGNNVVMGGAGVPFGDGLRCLGGSVVRLQVRLPNSSGSASTTIGVAAKGAVAPGETKHYQLWYRDVVASPCGANFNFSNGLTVTWQP